MKIVYIAGPYRGRTHDGRSYNEIEANIRAAEAAAIRLWDAGFGVFCPHLNTAHFEVLCPNVPASQYQEFDLRMLEACDILYLLPGWERSSGSVQEREKAWRTHWVYDNIERLIKEQG